MCDDRLDEIERRLDAIEGLLNIDQQDDSATCFTCTRWGRRKDAPEVGYCLVLKHITKHDQGCQWHNYKITPTL